MRTEAEVAVVLVDKFREELIPALHNKWFAPEQVPPEMPADHIRLQQQAKPIIRAEQLHKARITLQVIINPEL